MGFIFHVFDMEMILNRNDKLTQLYELEYLLEEYCDPYIAPQATHFSTSTPLDELQKTAQSCHLCGLSKGRTSVVFGEGLPTSPLMLVGDWPSQDDDRNKTPLGGKTRETLTAMIQNVLQIPMSDVYFSTLVKCKPALTNNPTHDEQMQCFPYLEGEINAIKPRLIITLGEAPFRALTHITSPLQNERGNVHYYHNIPIIPTYHPTFLARNPSERSKVLEDLLKAKSLLTLSPQ